MKTKKARRSIWLLQAVLVVVIMAMFAAGAWCSDIKNESPINVSLLQSVDNHWEVVHSSMNAIEGSVLLQNKKWLMYFLHWRPL